MTGGIICEYNPFHNGHMYHIEKTKSAGADFIVCVMSGNFVQRGECALIDKWQRAVCAIRGGADIVVDLPVPWAMASAENFARGSVYLLSCLGVDILSFGSETDSKELLQLCAEVSENEKVGALVKKYMSEGMNYPTALSEGVGQLFGNGARKIISSPNSTLGVEYIKQLRAFSKGADFLPVKRVGAVHDGDSTVGDFASASKIRRMTDSDYSPFVPDFTAEMIKENIKNKSLHSVDKAERAILSSLREMSREEYCLYVTDNSGLASRIYEGVKKARTLDELYENTKSKNYTHARIRREVMNLYLKIPKETGRKTPPYVKVLAANEKGLSLISRMKNSSPIPIITKHSETESLDLFGKEVYALQCSCTDKFSLMCDSIRPCGEEQRNSMIIVR